MDWNWFDIFATRMGWMNRGVNTSKRISSHRGSTHSDNKSPKYRARRKVRNAMAKASRRKNR